MEKPWNMIQMDIADTSKQSIVLNDKLFYLAHSSFSSLPSFSHILVFALPLLFKYRQLVKLIPDLKLVVQYDEPNAACFEYFREGQYRDNLLG